MRVISEISKEIGLNAFIQYRQQCGLSLREISDKMSMSPSYVSMVESRRKPVTKEFLKATFTAILGESGAF